MPSSPSLTNPDLILPYYASRPRSVSPPARNASSPSATRSSSVNRVAQPYRQTLTEADEAKAPLGVYTAPIVGMARPPLPGAWQTDEDLHRTTDTWTNQTVHVQPTSASQVEADYNSDDELHDTVNNKYQRSDSMGFIQEVAIPVENGLRDLALANRTPILGQSDERPFTVFEEDEVDPFSHAAEILANAKKRLTVSMMFKVTQEWAGDRSDSATGHGRQPKSSPPLSQCYTLYFEGIQWLQSATTIPT